MAWLGAASGGALIEIYRSKVSNLGARLRQVLIDICLVLGQQRLQHASTQLFGSVQSSASGGGIMLGPLYASKHKYNGSPKKSRADCWTFDCFELAQQQLQSTDTETASVRSFRAWPVAALWMAADPRANNSMFGVSRAQPDCHDVRKGGSNLHSVLVQVHGAAHLRVPEPQDEEHLALVVKGHPGHAVAATDLLEKSRAWIRAWTAKRGA